MLQTNWYVLTGPPAAGKTALAHLLSAYGYHVVVESARLILDLARMRAQPLSVGAEPFQRQVVEVNVAREAALDARRILFMDRAVPDTIAYCRMYGYDERYAMECARTGHRYKKVFMLELASYENDDVRTESEGFARRVGARLAEVYAELGYDTILVPWLPVHERAELVLRELGDDRVDDGSVAERLFGRLPKQRAEPGG